MAKRKGFSARPGVAKSANTAPEDMDFFVSGSDEPAKAPAPAREEPEATKKLTLNLSESQHMAFKMYAVREGRTMTSLLREWIEERVAEG
jgi:hypothetical protein